VSTFKSHDQSDGCCRVCAVPSGGLIKLLLAKAITKGADVPKYTPLARSWSRDDSEEHPAAGRHEKSGGAGFDHPHLHRQQGTSNQEHGSIYKIRSAKEWISRRLVHVDYMPCVHTIMHDHKQAKEGTIYSAMQCKFAYMVYIHIQHACMDVRQSSSPSITTHRSSSSTTTTTTTSTHCIVEPLKLLHARPGRGRRGGLLLLPRRQSLPSALRLKVTKPPSTSFLVARWCSCFLTKPHLRKLLLPCRAVRHRCMSSAVVNTVGKIAVALSVSLCFSCRNPRLLCPFCRTPASCSQPFMEFLSACLCCG
jgi:hypothetical protein